jgi:hypothetical protein
MDHAEWRKFSIHFRSLNIRHIGMIEATELKTQGLAVLQARGDWSVCTDRFTDTKANRSSPRLRLNALLGLVCSCNRPHLEVHEMSQDTSPEAEL